MPEELAALPEDAGRVQQQTAQLPPDAARPPAGAGDGADSDAAEVTQVGEATIGDFTQMSIAELLQLDLVLPQGAIFSAIEEVPQGDGEIVDLTELSLLELMDIRVTPEATPDLPDLNPDRGNLLPPNDEGLQGPPSHLSPDGGLTPIGVLPGTDYIPPPSPPPPPPDPTVNIAPVAKDDKYSVNEDGVLSVAVPGVRANDTDKNGDALTVSLVSDVLNGTLTLNANGSFTYTPDPDFNGKDVFTYQVSDGRGGVDTATVTITVNAINDAPVNSVPALQVVNEDDTLVFSTANGNAVSIADVDAGSGNLRVTLSTNDGALTLASTSGLTVSGNGTGSVVVTGSLAAINSALDGLSFAPTADFNGATSITITTDDKGNSGAGGPQIDIDTVDITVTPVNDAPVAADDDNAGDPVVEDSDAIATGNVLDNDTDVDTGDSLTVISNGTFAGTYGDLVINPDGTWAYTLDDTNPNTNKLADGQIVTDTFTYTVADKAGATDTADLVITITGANDAPVAADDDNAGDPVVEDSDATAAGNVLSNDTDVDAGDVLTVASAGTFAGTYGELVLNADGTWTYTLDNANPDTDKLAAGQTVTDTFTYTVADKAGATDTADLVITITGANDAPDAVDDAGTIDEDTALVVSAANGVLKNDTDVEGDALTVTAVNGSGAAVGNQIALASGALLTLNADGSYTYDPNGQFESLGVGDDGADSFTYTISDGNGGSDTATVNITITGVNDAPDAVDDAGTIDEDTALVVSAANGVLKNDTDVEGDALTVTAVNGSGAAVGNQIALASGALLTLNADGSYTYDPNGQFESLGVGDDGADSFTYTISDGSGGSDTATVNITITGVNDAPDNAAFTSGGSVDENSPNGTVVGTVFADDVDLNDTVTYSLLDDAGGRFDIDASTGVITVANGLLLDFEAAASHIVTVQATDGIATSTTALAIMINDVNPEDVTGDASANQIIGGAGDDTLSGAGGNDTLIGGGGSDSLDGGADDDFLDGGAGSDTLSGGDGDDTLVWDAADVTVDGGAGNDTLLVQTASIDLSTTTVAVTNIEQIDLGVGDASRMLTLRGEDVIDVTDASNTLIVLGDANDTVETAAGAGSGWVFDKSDTGFDYYKNDMGGGVEATLVVAADIDLIITP
jgi:VCBS repeat-containing protein